MIKMIFQKSKNPFQYFHFASFLSNNFIFDFPVHSFPAMFHFHFGPFHPSIQRGTEESSAAAIGGQWRALLEREREGAFGLLAGRGKFWREFRFLAFFCKLNFFGCFNNFSSKFYFFKRILL
jgi:hypothetical protein